MEIAVRKMDEMDSSSLCELRRTSGIVLPQRSLRKQRLGWGS
jgi:hypothetical protein